MSDKNWIMNCILWGLKVSKLLDAGKEAEAREELRRLTSEFDPKDIDYLIGRLKEV